MKIQIFCAIALAAMLSGCASSKSEGGAADNDKNVLTGGPTAGTTLQDLPQAVKDTLKEKMPQAEVADIDTMKRNGEMVYEISFRNLGTDSKLCVAEDGRVVSVSGKDNDQQQ